MTVDYIIVGQGLAGSAVAVQLLRLGRRIAVFDDPDANNSSRIAAGLFNPVTGNKMVRTWLADALFPYLHRFYREVEAATGASFFHELPVYRPFISVEEQNEWMARSADSVYAGYVAGVRTRPSVRGVRDEHGGLLLKQSGYLDTKRYIGAVAGWIRSSGHLFSEALVAEEVRVAGDTVSYRDVTASKIIFCHGVHANQWWDWLPVRPLKGETITVRATIAAGQVVNRGAYLVPGTAEDIWRAGATYSFRDQTPGITPAGRAELREKLSSLLSEPFEVLGQEWGLRPTVPDRRPILGAHPRQERLIVFNGLGTKGVSLAPYFSEVLVHRLENRGSIHQEVDIERFKSVYSGSPK